MSLFSLLRAEELEERRRGVEPFLRREPEMGGLDWVVGGIVQVWIWLSKDGSTVAVAESCK